MEGTVASNGQKKKNKKNESHTTTRPFYCIQQETHNELRHCMTSMNRDVAIALVAIPIELLLMAMASWQG